MLRANLQALDGAIRETRSALQARPDDDVARREPVRGPRRQSGAARADRLAHRRRTRAGRSGRAATGLIAMHWRQVMRAAVILAGVLAAGVVSADERGRQRSGRSRDAASAQTGAAAEERRVFAVGPGSTLDVSNVAGDVRITTERWRVDRRAGSATAARQRSARRRAAAGPAARDVTGRQPGRGAGAGIDVGALERCHRPLGVGAAGHDGAGALGLGAGRAHGRRGRSPAGDGQRQRRGRARPERDAGQERLGRGQHPRRRQRRYAHPRERQRRHHRHRGLAPAAWRPPASRARFASATSPPSGCWPRP